MVKKVNYMRYYNKTPDCLEIHTSPELIHKWINYSTLDAEITFFLYYSLK